MEIALYPYKLRFKYPFQIAHTLREFTDVCYIRLSHQGVSAWGEAVFPPYVKENLNLFQSFIEQISLPSDLLNTNLQDYTADIKQHFPDYTASLAGLEMALISLQSQLLNKTIPSYLGVPVADKPTSFTIGISSNETIKQKIEENKEVAYYKLKVDQDNFERIISAYLHCTNKPFVIDANQGFTNRLAALSAAEQLARLGVAYLEQPFHKEDFASHEWLKRLSPIPIIADESFQKKEDLAKVEGAFHGVNVKLMKCGGLLQAKEILLKAKEMDLKTVLGCMSDSSVATDAARHLVALADWVDLDGPLLIQNDLFAQYAPQNEEQILSQLKAKQ